MARHPKIKQCYKLFRISIELFDMFVSKCIGIDFVRLTKI